MHPTGPGAYDDEDTLAFYDREAAAYAARNRSGEWTRLGAFVAALPKGARVLDLGCGGGQEAAAMQAAGLRVTAVDGAPGLAAEASRRLGRPVGVMRFADLDDDKGFEGIWANASLLHVPMEGLSEILRRVHRALTPGGAPRGHVQGR